MCDSNGDPLCPSKIRYGLGPVPDSYFVDAANAMPDYDQETAVYAGDKHLIEIKCKKGSVIRFVHFREESFTVFPKTCWEFEFDIFEAKKRFPDSGKAYCVLKRKVAKMRVLLKNDPFWGMCEESEFDIYKFPRIQENLYIDAKIRYTAFLE